MAGTLSFQCPVSFSRDIVTDYQEKEIVTAFEIVSVESALIGLSECVIAVLLVRYLQKLGRLNSAFGICAVVFLAIISLRNGFGVAREFVPDPTYYDYMNGLGALAALVVVALTVILIVYLTRAAQHSEDPFSDLMADVRSIHDLELQRRSIRVIADASPNIVIMTDTKGQVTWLNKTFYSTTGVPFTGDFMMDLQAATHPDDWHRVLAAYRRAIFSDRGEFKAEIRYRMKDGEYHWYLLRCSCMRDIRGRIWQWFIASTDIHDEKLRMMRTESALESFVQFYLSNTLPQFENLAFDSVYRPASNQANVGGDWYDHFVLKDGRVAVSVGDVGGHGIEAAIWMGRVKASMYNEALDVNPDPANVLRKANRLLALRDNSPMVTALYGIIDYKKMTFTYATAGHYPPVLVKQDGTSSVLGYDGIPLGVEDDLGEPKVFTENIDPHSMLVFYTDGLVEATRNLFEGTERLISFAKEAMQRTEKHPAKFIVEHVINKELEKVDDVAVLTITFGEKIEPCDFELTLPAVKESASIARQKVEEYVVGCGVSAEEAAALMTATGEAIINACEHAYKRSSSIGDFHIKCKRTATAVTIEVEDYGRWTDPGEVADSELDPFSVRGRGIMLMQAFSDSVRFYNKLGTHGGAVVIINKALPDAASDGDEEDTEAA